MSSLKVGALSDTEIASHIQNLQSEQTRRSKMRQEAQSFLAGSPGRQASLAALLGPLHVAATNSTNGNGQHKPVATKGKPKTVKAKAPLKIKIKYRNPENPLETWSGRGRKARWLTTAMEKTGRPLDAFKA